jgi:hypothetical protein
MSSPGTVPEHVHFTVPALLLPNWIRLLTFNSENTLTDTLDHTLARVAIALIKHLLMREAYAVIGVRSMDRRNFAAQCPPAVDTQEAFLGNTIFKNIRENVILFLANATAKTPMALHLRM